MHTPYTRGSRAAASRSPSLDAPPQVSLKYREALPAALSEALLRAAPRFQAMVLLPALRDFMLEQLTRGAWPAEGQLKEYLGYAAADLDDHAWFTAGFPEELSLAHAYETYTLLSRCMA